ncbi:MULTISPECIES: hypothetical protein [unclassified Mycobacterium]|uniref:hypothetical protein n=1 Tax=unclassified Mycobacterium TaxID=2642494 RepID=UPI0009E902B7|nr:MULTISPECIES: hypothetical protein [unclassified Mycobacterium]
MAILNEPFVGSEAVINGAIRKHELRSRYRTVFPDVYMSKGVVPSLYDRAKAAWLWSHREGVMVGLTASALHGAKWVDDDAPIEMLWRNTRAPQGMRTYDMRVPSTEYQAGPGFPMTTLARTGFDIGRRQPLDEAVARLDALGNATGLSADDVLAVARSHRGARGLRRLEEALKLYDAGAASPKETWLRLLVIRAGYPRPQTQIPVRSPDGLRQYYLDMGWPDMTLAVEYDGEQHRLDPREYAYDIRRSEDVAALGWTRIRAVKAHSGADILRRLDRAWRSKLHTDREIS